MSLTEQDFENAAARLQCDVAAIKAVCEVEAPRGGFNPDGSVATLFEGHKFHKYTYGKFDGSHPTLSFPTWDRRFYGKTWQAEQARVMEAMQLNYNAACLSTSWGRFQIMGFNFAEAGFATIADFVSAMQESEASQLDAFCELIEEWGLVDELQCQSWTSFARVYNGPKFRDNHYDTKLASAFNKWSRSSTSA